MQFKGFQEIKHIWDDVEIVPTSCKEVAMFNSLLPHLIVIGVLLSILAIFTIGKIQYSPNGKAGSSEHKPEDGAS